MTAHFAQHIEVVSEPGAAVQRALETAAPEDAIFITGSLYLVGDVRKWWKARRAAQLAARAV
jgi:folylpolyglutamate synthase/dihydropteroate synthase